MINDDFRQQLNQQLLKIPHETDEMIARNLISSILQARGYLGFRNVLETLLKSTGQGTANKLKYTLTALQNTKYCISLLVEILDKHSNAYSLIMESVKLTLEQNLVIACALGQSYRPQSAKIGIQFIRANIKQIRTMGPKRFSPHFIHNFLYYVSTSNEFSPLEKKELLSSFMWFYKNQLSLAPHFYHVNLNTTPENERPHLTGMSYAFMKQDIIQSKATIIMDEMTMVMQYPPTTHVQTTDMMILANFMNDVGYASTCNVKVFSAILNSLLQQSTHIEATIARAIGFLSSTSKNKGLRKGTQNLVTFLSEINPAMMEYVEEGSKKNTWNTDVFATAVNTQFPQIDWVKVIHALDYEELKFEDSSAVATIAVIYRKATDKKPFPIECLINRLWENSEAQLKMLLYGLELPPDIMNFDSKSIKQTSTCKNPPQSLHDAWKSSGFIKTLLILSQFSSYEAVKKAFATPMKEIPENLLIAVCESQLNILPIMKEIIGTLMPTFISTEHLDVLKKILEYTPFLFHYYIQKSYADDKSNLSVILDIVMKLNVLEYVVFDSALMIQLRTRLAILAAAKHGRYLLLTLFLNELLFISETDALVEAMKYFLETGEIESQEIKIHATVLTCLEQNRHQNYIQTLKLSTTTVEKVQQEYKATRFSDDIEQLSTEKLKHLFENKMKLESAINLIKDLKESDHEQKQSLYKCMIFTILDEYKYPQMIQERGVIFAELWSALINEDLLEADHLAIAKTFIFLALKGNTDYSRTFGIRLLTKILKLISNWPVFCSFVKLQPPEILDCIENIHLYLDSSKKPKTYSTSRGGFKTNLDISVILMNIDIVEPSEKEKNEITFILNTLSPETLEKQALRMKKIISEKYFEYFANFLVTNRISLESNFHKQYLELLELMDEPKLNQIVLDFTYKCTRRILDNGELSLASSDGKILQAFGNWIGLCTISQNKPILITKLDLRTILIDAAIRNTLFQVVRFVRTVLKYVKESDIFKPPNPWTMMILSIFAELKSVNNLPYELQTEIDILIIEELNMLYKDIKKKTPRILGSVMDVPEDNIYEEFEFDESKIRLVQESYPPLIIDTNRFPMFKTYPKLNQLVHHAQRKAITSAWDKTKKNVIPIVCTATAHIVSNDFIFQSETNEMMEATSLMVRNFASNFILFTCPGIIQENMYNQLKEWLLSILKTPRTKEVEAAIELAVKTITTDNLKRAVETVEKEAISVATNTISNKIKEFISTRPRNELIKRKNLLPPELCSNQGVTTKQFSVYKRFNEGRHVLPGVPSAEKVVGNEDSHKQLDFLFEKIMSIVKKMKPDTNLYSLDPKDDIVQLLVSYRQTGQFCQDKSIIMNKGIQYLDSILNYNEEVLRRDVFISLMKSITQIHPEMKKIYIKRWLDHPNRFEPVFLPLFAHELIELPKGHQRLATFINKNYEGAVQFGCKVIQNSPPSSKLYGFSPELIDAVVARVDELNAPDREDILARATKSLNLRFSLIVQQSPNGQSHLELFKSYLSAYQQLLPFDKKQQIIKQTLTKFLTNIDNSIDEFESFLITLIHRGLSYFSDFIRKESSTISFSFLDAVSDLVIHLCRSMKNMDHVYQVISKSLNVVSRILIHQAVMDPISFNQRPFLRFLSNLLHGMDLIAQNSQDHLNLLSYFSNAFISISPNAVPSFSFAWLDLISHRKFMPIILGSKDKVPLNLHERSEKEFHDLFLELFRFLRPFIENQTQLDMPHRLLHRSTVKILLVVVHDFSDFLCNYCYSLCDEIPVHCIQLHNLIFSAFPKNESIDDPRQINHIELDYNSTPPVIKSDYENTLSSTMYNGHSLKNLVFNFLKTRNQIDFLNNIHLILLNPTETALNSGHRYNRKLINALVIYMAVETVRLQSELLKSQKDTNSIYKRMVEIVKRAVVHLDAEGRYIFLEALANQLRYPNIYTYMFTFVLFHLFEDEELSEFVHEQIARVLIERAVIIRPNCWGAILTMQKLTPLLMFKSFTQIDPTIKNLFERLGR